MTKYFLLYVLVLNYLIVGRYHLGLEKIYWLEAWFFSSRAV